ncbi:hypothetical protein EW145_g2163 [Phellinidium pouzarii]|uniref:Uncharacterized protein n=1 Tax=Phellinidium pouzarii TaxID=167371 RepID=A0A4V3XDD4_9AGAM|nr:hypothetical protein EW145_g2163 [Phellinidium pouzarii]
MNQPANEINIPTRTQPPSLTTTYYYAWKYGLALQSGLERLIIMNCSVAVLWATTFSNLRLRLVLVDAPYDIEVLKAIKSASLLSVRAEDDPTFTNIVYLIRNGEMNTNKVGSGLSVQGEERAQCLKNVFAPPSNLTIGYILAEPAKKNGNGTEAIDTITPLAQELGLTVDTSWHVRSYDSDCVGDAASAFAANSTASILICWEREYLPDIAEVLGVNDVPSWPKKSFNVIWTVQNNTLIDMSSEDCPGLDD